MLQLNAIGIVLIVLALIHIGFPRYFNWETELRTLTLINRQMMEVHTLFIAITVLLMGICCCTSAHELITTPLGRRIAFGFFIFWVIRLLVQLFGYSPVLWKGKTFETTIHVIFLLLWTYISMVFLAVALPGMF